MLKEITVKGLFGRFDYRVRLRGEGVTVLTGPNGFGKSTLFSLVEAVANGNRGALFSMPGRELSLEFNGGERFDFVKAANGGYTENGEEVSPRGELTAAEKRAAKLLGAVRRAGGDGLSSAVRGGEEKIREYANKLRSIPDAAGRAYNAGGSDRARAELLRDLLSDKLAFKTATIGSGGLEFTDDDGEKLDFFALSAGEIRLTEFYADLLFGTPDGALLLIDEPEVSMHIAWQFTLVDDVKEICRALGGASAIIATHSPQILGGHRDLQVDLGEQYGE